MIPVRRKAQESDIDLVRKEMWCGVCLAYAEWKPDLSDLKRLDKETIRTLSFPCAVRALSFPCAMRACPLFFLCVDLHRNVCQQVSAELSAYHLMFILFNRLLT